MPTLAHIGNIPVEEWLPFVAPVVVLYLIGRRAGKRRRAEVRRLPPADELLDGATVQRVLARWAQTRHADARSRHVPLFYPPGPEGSTGRQLAERLATDSDRVERLLGELEELGYVELDGLDSPVVLTVEGYDLLNETESVLLETVKQREAAQATR